MAGSAPAAKRQKVAQCKNAAAPAQHVCADRPTSPTLAACSASADAPERPFAASQGTLNDTQAEPFGVRAPADPPVIPEKDHDPSPGDLQKLMKDIAAYVVVKLPAFLEENASLLGEGGAQKGRKPEEYHPLPVATKGSTGLTSFKPPWNVDEAPESLRIVGMYEASANLLSLHPFAVGGAAQHIAGAPPSWKNLWQAMAFSFSAEGRQDHALATTQGAGVKRLVFPITIPAHCPAPEAGSAAGTLGSFSVISGHIYLWAWYLAMFGALQGKDMLHAASLWQMALTVTVQLRHGLSDAQKAAWSISCAELARSNDLVVSVCDEVLVDPGGGLLVTAESLPEANRSHGSPRK